MGARKNTDSRSSFRGHDAAVVSGGRRVTTAYLAEDEYQALIAVCEKRDQSVSSFLKQAIGTAVKRASR